MAYDLELAERIRAVVGREHGLSEKAMFGGLAFLINGNMSVSASGRGGLMLRCDPATSEEHVASPHVERMIMRGREMDGWLRVDTRGIESDVELQRWVRVGVDYAKSLPPK
jgi:hypothetical protein